MNWGVYKSYALFVVDPVCFTPAPIPKDERVACFGFLNSLLPAVSHEVSLLLPPSCNKSQAHSSTVGFAAVTAAAVTAAAVTAVVVTLWTGGATQDGVSEVIG